jgi:cytoskeleton protein RodZ
MTDSERRGKIGKKNQDTEQPRLSGVGAFLREERRNRSLELRQVAKMTRLRIYFLEAIEKEAWDELPAPVFVMGFIRSYANALGLDEGYAIGLYKEVQPFEPTVPKPLQVQEKTGRGRVILLILLLGILGGVLLYLWQQGTAPHEKPRVSPESAETKTTETEPVAPPPEMPQERVEEETATEATADPGALVDEGVEPEEKKEDSVAVEPSQPVENAPVISEVEGKQEPPQMTGEPEAKMVLEAEVQKRTWVQISVDGKEPKAFNFQPGSHIRWEAEKEFDILIGNAGGMVMLFNGKKLSQLGEEGQVIRLKLPADLETEGRGAP